LKEGHKRSVYESNWRAPKWIQQVGKTNENEVREYMWGLLKRIRWWSETEKTRNSD